MEEQEKVWKPMFEPAAEGDKPAKGVWVPNRAYRRAIKKNANKIKSESVLAPDVSNVGRNLLQDPEFRQELYKDLYLNLIKKRAELMEKEKEYDTIEGNEDLQGSL